MGELIMLFDTKIDYKNQANSFSLAVKKSIGHYEMSQCHLHAFFEIYYLSRSFKEATGFTFIEYLNHVRIKEAQRLLQGSHQKVMNIAEQVGFGSIAHFGRVFKAVTGQSPLYYRRKMRAGGVKRILFLYLA